MHEIIKNAVEATKQNLQSHWKTLLGERPGGSQWGREFTEDDFALEWTEATDTVDPELKSPGCHYFRLSPAEVERAFPDRKLGAIPLNQLEPDEMQNVRIHNGPHGPELRYHGELDVEGAADEAWMIIGPEDGTLVVFTAHPGPLMKPLPADTFKGFFEKPYAVKI